MKIRNMRWGVDGGGFASGPAEGNTLVEVIVTGDQERNFFVEDIRTEDQEKILVSEVPLFDLIMECNHYDVDLHYEQQKIEELTKESYEFSSAEVPEEILNSRFGDTIRLAHHALEVCHEKQNPDAASARIFILPYINMDPKDIDMFDDEF